MKTVLIIAVVVFVVYWLYSGKTVGAKAPNAPVPFVNAQGHTSGTVYLNTPADNGHIGGVTFNLPPA